MFLEKIRGERDPKSFLKKWVRALDARVLCVRARAREREGWQKKNPV